MRISVAARPKAIRPEAHDLLKRFVARTSCDATFGSGRGARRGLLKDQYWGKTDSKIV
jgi:hypothetical protein